MNSTQLVQLLAAVKDRNWRACESWGTANQLYDTFDAPLTIAEALTGRDALTGLLNLAGYKSRAKAMLQQAHREQRALFVTVLDLDGLKQVNDGPGGHHAGDMLIIEFAELLKSEVRSSDCVARIGGDEFVMLATSDCSSRLCQVSAEYASCGAASVQICSGHWDEESAVRLLDYAMILADEQMYENKKARKEL